MKAGRADSFLPSWYNDSVTIASSIALALGIVRWIYKNGNTLKKLVVPVNLAVLFALSFFFPPKIRSASYSFILGRVTSVWGPYGPRPLKPGQLGFPLIVTALVMGGIFIVSLRELRRLGPPLQSWIGYPVRGWKKGVKAQPLR